MHHRFVYREAAELKRRNVRSILDVGCGRGFLVSHFIEMGFSVMGTETSPYLLGKDLRKLPVFPFNIGGLRNIEEDEFDLVLMIDLLDHLRDEEEVSEALRHADRIAQIGIMITLGGKSDLRCIFSEGAWWRDKFKDEMSIPLQAVTADNDVCRYCFWRPGE